MDSDEVVSVCETVSAPAQVSIQESDGTGKYKYSSSGAGKYLQGILSNVTNHPPSTIIVSVAPVPCMVLHVLDPL